MNTDPCTKLLLRETIDRIESPAQIIRWGRGDWGVKVGRGGAMEKEPGVSSLRGRGTTERK